MKKIGKMLFVCLLAVIMTFFAFACGKTNEQEIPEPGKGKVSINDAYDWNEDETGSTRPDLGGDYEPVLPPTSTTLKIAEGSSVRFKGGAKELELDIGAYLTEDDFDASTLEGHRIGGVGILGENKEIATFVGLEGFAPMDDMTIWPYWKAERGASYTFGSKQVPDYYYDADGNDLSENPEYAMQTGYTLVDGFPGKRLTVDATLEKDSYFRAVTACEREDGQRYTYYYRFVNLGESEISFTVYQMFTGHDWSDSSTGVASDPIKLTAGQTDIVEITVDNTKNDGNTLTLIKMDEPSSIDLGVSMEVKNSTPTAPAKITLDLPDGFTVNGYKTDVMTNDKLVLPTAAQITNNTGRPLLGWAYADGTKAVEGVRIKGDITLKPLLAEHANVTLSLPKGFTVSGFSGKQFTGEKLVLPTAAQITNNTSMGEFSGWYDTESRKPVNASTVLSKDITIAPYWQAYNGYDYLKLGSGANSGYNTAKVPGEIVSHFASKDATYNGNTTNKTVTVPVKGKDGFAVNGISVSDKAPITAGSALRFDSKLALTAESTVVEFNYTFENRGTTPVKLSVYQISSSSEYQTAGGYYAYESRYRVEFNLAPGESDTKIGKYLLGKNTNALTYIVFENDVASFDIGIAVSTKFTENTDVDAEYKNQPALSNPVTIAFDSAANKGATVDAEYLTQRAGRFIVAPAEGQYTVPAGEVLRGWRLVSGDSVYDLSNEITGYQNPRVPSSPAKLIAVYAEDATVTVDTPEGLTVSAKTAYKTGEKFVLPEVTANTTGKTIAGWYDVENNVEVTANTVIEKNITVAPYLVIEGGAVLSPCIGADNGTLPDYYGYYDDVNEYHPYTDADGDKLDLSTIFGKTNYYSDYTKGIVLNSQTAFKVNDAFRYKTAASPKLDGKKTYTITIKFTNLAENAVSFDVYQINSKQVITGNTAVKAGTVSLTKGQSVELSVDISFSNSNLLTMIVMKQATNGLSLGISMTQSLATA